MAEDKSDNKASKNTLSKEDRIKLEKELLNLFEEFRKLINKDDTYKNEN
jgi:hypothetical protein